MVRIIDSSEALSDNDENRGFGETDFKVDTYAVPRI